MNLDRLAAKTAQTITEKFLSTSDNAEEEKKVKELENAATKALGVLHENGVYATMLYLFAKQKDKAFSKIIREELLKLLKADEIHQMGLQISEDILDDWLEVGKHLTEKVCQKLDHLLLIKQLWEQTLIYTRFCAKAKGEPDELESA